MMLEARCIFMYVTSGLYFQCEVEEMRWGLLGSLGLIRDLILPANK